MYIKFMGRVYSSLMVFVCLFWGCSSDISVQKYPHDDTPLIESISDTKYYGVPRLLIETDKHLNVLDRETDLHATMRLYGEDTSVVDEHPITIRGRGNTSWDGIPKKSYKIEFEKKAPLLGMPENKDWVLIPNYSDKTLIKNYIAYRLSANLGATYTPRCDFVELYLNGQYLGLYLLCEKIKEGKNRVKLPKDTLSYIVEVDFKYRAGEQVVISEYGVPFRIHYPKNATRKQRRTLLAHIIEFEEVLKAIDSTTDIAEWIDLDAYIRHFWIQEALKNPDATFFSSVYFTWTVNTPIKMGPVWDFDLSMGGHTTPEASDPEGWLTKDSYWNKFLFTDKEFSNQIDKYWKENRAKFYAIIDSVEQNRTRLKAAALHNFEQWKILDKQDSSLFNRSFDSYDDAVDHLKDWLQHRFDWISEQTGK